MKHAMYITGEVLEPMMGYSWAWTFGLYHPCMLLSGLTRAWSIWIIAVSIFEVGRYLQELGMPPLTLPEEGLTKGTSCPSHSPMSGAS